jgi:phosphonopyruvate decarboxylase
MVDLAHSMNDSAWTAVGVPCSTLEPWLLSMPEPIRNRMLIAPNEGEAVAFSAGTWLAGGMGLAAMQNSGVGNAINAFTSLLSPFQIPVALLVGWRGAPGVSDEPQHRLMGRITPSILAGCDIETISVSQSDFSSADILCRLADQIGKRRSCAVLFPPFAGKRSGAGPYDSTPTPSRQVAAPCDSTHRDSLPTKTILELCCEQFDAQAVFVATTGYCARELFAIADGPNKFYMVGSMGHAAALGLGIAVKGRRRVVVLDGDGALLMRLGTLALVGGFQQLEFVHIVLNNGVHESTGAQPVCGGASVNLRAVADACGYPQSWAACSISDLKDMLKAASQLSCPVFIDVSAARRSAVLPRIPDELSELACRFRDHISDTVPGSPAIRSSLAY